MGNKVIGEETQEMQDTLILHSLGTSAGSSFTLEVSIKRQIHMKAGFEKTFRNGRLKMKRLKKIDF